MPRVNLHSPLGRTLIHHVHRLLHNESIQCSNVCHRWAQVLFFCGLRRCEILDLSGRMQLDGRIFWALAGTASTLTSLNSEGFAAVRMHLCTCQCHIRPAGDT